MAAQLTTDPVYQTFERDDFMAMIDVDRYAKRSDAFDQIIAATHDHFWDPTDPAYLDFAMPFDLENDYIMPPSRVPELQSAVADKLDEGQQIRLANQVTRWTVSNILHGEQGALSLSAERRRSTLSVAATMRPDRLSLATARDTRTLSMAVRSETSLAEAGAKRPSTAITRHSAIESPKRAPYSLAMAWLMRLVSTDRR